jgi:hypothetical protein
MRFVVITAVLATIAVIAQPQNLKGPVAGAAECAACHKKTYDRWSDSIHGKMIQPASKSTVLARSELSGGPSVRRLWRNGAFFIEEDGVENRVDLTLGNRRIQHYLTYKSNGQVIVLHSTWDVKRQQWFDSAEIVPNAPPHFVQQWNMTCFYCHVTQQRQDVKGFDAKTLTYRTSWVESSASCERCHGPMSEHASGREVVNSFRRELASADRYDKLMVCGQCHWAKIVLATGYNTRKSYFDYYSPGLIHMDATEPGAPSWWADGRPRRFSLEAAGFFLSGCFQSAKAFCTSCHDPHWNRTDGNEELMNRPDQYCKNCHAGYDAESHTRHAAGSTGSSCVGCHMPYAVSGVKSKMRDHSFLPPEPENTIAYDIPNACNECHTDQTSHWAVGYVNQWYPKRSERPRLRAKTFSLAARRSPEAIEYLVRLAEDRTENPLIRASAVGYFSQYRSDRLNKTLIKLSTDNDPMVRLESARALAGINNIDAIRALGHALSDVFRTIRIQAAASLIDDSFLEEPPQLDKANPQFAAALQEYRESLEVDADNPTMQVRRGSLEFFLGELPTARAAYELALKLDPRQADAYVGLALVEAKLGNLEEALKHAKNATKVSDDEKYRRFFDRMKLVKR